MSTEKRLAISLACELCGSRNYRTSRRKQQGATDLTLKKYCKTCNKHTIHRETK